MLEQNTNIRKKGIMWGVIVVFVILGLFAFAYYHNRPSLPIVQAPQTPTVASELTRKTTYICGNNFSVDVNFTNNKAELTLSDGRAMTLSQIPVSEGVEFTNGDGSFIFLTRGPNASVIEGGKVTHSDCIEPKG